MKNSHPKAFNPSLNTAQVSRKQQQTFTYEDGFNSPELPSSVSPMKAEESAYDKGIGY